MGYRGMRLRPRRSSSVISRAKRGRMASMAPVLISAVVLALVGPFALRPDVASAASSWITNYPMPSAAGPMTQGADGNMWVCQGSEVGRITPSGAATEFPLVDAGCQGSIKIGRAHV